MALVEEAPPGDEILEHTLSTELWHYYENSPAGEEAGGGGGGAGGADGTRDTDEGKYKHFTHDVLDAHYLPAGEGKGRERATGDREP